MSHSNQKALAFLAVFGSMVAIAVAWYLVETRHADSVTLNDPRAPTVTVATDLEAYQVLAEAQSSPQFNDTVQTLRVSGRIIDLPNGAKAQQLGSNRPNAAKIRVRAGPHEGLEVWTSPDFVHLEYGPWL